jgi:hypothetical protein
MDPEKKDAPYSGEKKVPGSDGNVKISGEKFSAAMDKIASDPEFRKKLEQKPIETFAAIGIEFDAKTQKLMQNKKFSELIAEQKAAAIPWPRYVAKIVSGVRTIIEA